MIDLHYVATSNGLKALIALEELGVDYRIVPYELFAGEHLKPAYKAINPNHKLPAIVDQDVAGEDGFPVFETGAILIYLAEKFGALLPVDPLERSTAIQWTVWQVAGLGPMLGQAYHFVRYAPLGQDYAVDRYRNEAIRLLHVLNRQLAGRDHVAGDYSIADIACWPWVQNIANIDLRHEDFPHIHRWSDAMRERPAVRRALDVGSIPTQYLNRRMELSSGQWSNLFGDNLHGATARYD